MEELYALCARSYGAETAENIRTGFSSDRPVTFRANTLKTTVSEVLFALSGFELERVPWYEAAFVLRGEREAISRAPSGSMSTFSIWAERSIIFLSSSGLYSSNFKSMPNLSRRGEES